MSIKRYRTNIIATAIRCPPLLTLAMTNIIRNVPKAHIAT